ncbi:hypothetical protein OVY48_18705 [Sphingobium sp. SA2]|uniref:hypothetical protein n=1 Tax=Sphingobium sp. SA2 TaxID=1524832 RepID=UPI0028C2358F|nr:hypothetical protein [Sphingobium sp. SA2]MDT7535438.1 hypothetical protein [Sphingobium sp. SA2]
MEEPNLSAMPIQPPLEYSSAKAGRHAAKALAGAIPVVGSAVTELIDGLVPDPAGNDRKRWEGEVTDSVNGLARSVRDIARNDGKREVTYSGAQVHVAKFLTENCRIGIPDYVEVDVLATADPSYSRTQIEDAIADLEADGLVRDLDGIGGTGLIELSDHAYEALDPVFMGWDPRVDAKLLAAHIVSRREEYSLSAPDMEAAMGWPRRRFNPALRIVSRFIKCVGDELQPSYVYTCVAPTAAEFSHLRRFAAED